MYLLPSTLCLSIWSSESLVVPTCTPTYLQRQRSPYSVVENFQIKTCIYHQIIEKTHIKKCKLLIGNPASQRDNVGIRILFINLKSKFHWVLGCSLCQGTYVTTHKKLQSRITKAKIDRISYIVANLTTWDFSNSEMQIGEWLIVPRTMEKKPQPPTQCKENTADCVPEEIASALKCCSQWWNKYASSSVLLHYSPF